MNSFNSIAHQTIQDPSGKVYSFRLLNAEDAENLHRYFESLSTETCQQFGPHPFDLATVRRLCADLNPQKVMRFVVLDGDPIIAYFILEMSVSVYETDRYRARQIGLNSDQDCTFAPSVADNYQNRHIGSVAARAVLSAARQLNRRKVVLMGGTHASNSRAIHFYRKLGFEWVAEFEYPAGTMNYDMCLDLGLPNQT